MGLDLEEVRQRLLYRVEHYGVHYQVKTDDKNYNLVLVIQNYSMDRFLDFIRNENIKVDMVDLASKLFKMEDDNNLEVIFKINNASPFYRISNFREVGINEIW